MTNAASYSDRLTLAWREYRPSTDSEYILSSWLRSYCLCPEVRGLPAPVYYELYTPVVKRLVETGEVRIAFEPELPDTIVGFRVMTGDVLHYVFTKRIFRRMGVAKWMLRELPATVRYTPQVFGKDRDGNSVPWHFGYRLLRDGWVRDAMARWPGRHSNRTETMP